MTFKTDHIHYTIAIILFSHKDVFILIKQPR